MYKLGVVVIVICTVIFMGASLCCAEASKAVTNAEFADMLVGILSLDMPEGSKDLSDTEFFEVQANILAKRGITVFIDKDPDAIVTRGMVADVLYDALEGPSTMTLQEKIDHIINSGYMSSGAMADAIMLDEMMVILNVPALSGAIAEAYSSPEENGVFERAASPPVRSFPAPESPASPV